jgi:hypothetical protein
VFGVGRQANHDLESLNRVNAPLRCNFGRLGKTSEVDLEVDFSELPALLSYAEGIARSTARALDQPEAVSPNAERALDESARELHIDHGESWGRLLGTWLDVSRASGMRLHERTR